MSHITFVPSATLTEGSALAVRSSGVISKPNLQANLTALRSRSGSSCSVIRAGRGVLIMPVRYIIFCFVLLILS